jgi:hypothetical protein
MHRAGGCKRAISTAEENGYRIAESVRNCQVRVAIAIEVTYRNA